MVRSVDDKCFVHEPTFLERRQDPADLEVEKGAEPEICPERSVQARRVKVVVVVPGLTVVRDRRVAGPLVVAVEPRASKVDTGVEVEELVRRDQRVMRRHHRAQKRPRPGVPLPLALLEPPNRRIRYRRVIACVGRISAPGIERKLPCHFADMLLLSEQPVGVSDSARDMHRVVHLAESIVVIRASITELSDGHDVIAGVAETMMPGGGPAVIRGGAVPVAGTVDEFPGCEARARGNTDGGIAIGAFKDNAAGRQAVEVGCFDDRVAVAACEFPAVLVGQDEEYIHDRHPCFPSPRISARRRTRCIVSNPVTLSSRFSGRSHGGLPRRHPARRAVPRRPGAARVKRRRRGWQWEAGSRKGEWDSSEDPARILMNTEFLYLRPLRKIVRLSGAPLFRPMNYGSGPCHEACAAGGMAVRFASFRTSEILMALAAAGPAPFREGRLQL